MISFSGDGTDPDDGALPASAFSWSVDFLRDASVEPISAAQGKSGSFTIPISGRDFSGNTRYRITLTVTDSAGLKDTKSVVVVPRKVNLRLETAPSGGTIHLDGVAKAAPAVYDTLVGLQHTLEVRDQAIGGGNYTFDTWSDGGAQAAHDHCAGHGRELHRDAEGRGVDSPAGVRAGARRGGQRGDVDVGRVHQQQRRRQSDRRVRDLEQHGQRVDVGQPRQHVRERGRARDLGGAAGGARRCSMPRTSPAGPTRSPPPSRPRSTAAGGRSTCTSTRRGPRQPVQRRVRREGTARAMSSGAVTTSSASLLFSAGASSHRVTAAGPDFTTRSTAFDNRTMDRISFGAGTYTATMTQDQNQWVQHLVAFKSAASPGPAN